jgi:ATP-dependent Lhr-like helicase
MEGFRSLLGEINDGTITLSFFLSGRPSPFARDLVREETNALIYEYDERKDIRGPASGGQTLSDKVIQEALGEAALRPALKPELTVDFVSRLRRELPGWAPEDEASLCEWVKERVAIPQDEWETLLSVLPEKLKESLATHLPDRLKLIKREGATVPSLVHREWEKAWEEEALTLLGPWLRYEGPVSVIHIREVFGASLSEAEDALNALAELQEIVLDVKIAHDASPHSPFICDRENLEMLLRLSRKKNRPVVKESPATLLAPFLALRQGFFDSAPVWKSLAAYTTPAKLWETEFFPARRIDYEPEALDREIGEGRLVFYGAGKERIGFCRPEDLDLALCEKKREQADDQASAGFFDRHRDYWEIKEELVKKIPGISGSDCVRALWSEVWQGRLSADSFEPLRRGMEHGFVPGESADAGLSPSAAATPFTPSRHPRVPRALRDRWKGGAPVLGRWFSLDTGAEGGEDPLDEEMLNRERVRLLLGRWGFLCRPLLEHEAPCFSWSRLLPSIRRMELSGELVSGRFFSGINSLQFAPPAIVREIEQAQAISGIYGMNAADPASLAGLDIEGLPPHLPARSSSNRLYYRGSELIAVTKRGGKELQIFINLQDADLAALIARLKTPRTRKTLPEKKLLIESINGQSAASSPYLAPLREAGFVSDRGRLLLWG